MMICLAKMKTKRKRNGNKKGGEHDSSTSASTAATDPNSRGLKKNN
jgi:hypothetical protein